MGKSKSNVIFALFITILRLLTPADGSEPNEKSQNTRLCSDDITESASGKFIWKSTGHDAGGYAVAENNICWNNSTNQITIRQCIPTRNLWLPADVTCTRPTRKYRFCPEDLIEIELRNKNEFICIKLSKKPQRFEENFCYGSDTLATTENLTELERIQLSSYLLERDIKKFWLPVWRANNGRANNPYVITLPGKYWYDTFNIPQSLNDLLSNKSCMAVNVSDADLQFSIEMSHCDEHIHAVCVFKKYFVASSGCPQGFGAMSYRPNKCYGVEWQAGLFPELDALPLTEYLEKRNIFQMILKEKDRDSKRFFLVDGFRDNIGNNYGIEMNAKERFRVVALEKAGPALSSENVTDRKKVEMVLKMDAEMQDLILIVYNRNYIWRLDDHKNYGIKCFTNADYEFIVTVNMKKIWENDLTTKTIYKLKMIDKGPGYYWCQAHTIFDFSLITTPQFVAVKRLMGHAYAAVLDVACMQNKCLNIFQNFKSFGRELKGTLDNFKNSRHQLRYFKDLVIHNVRLMEIVSINSTKSTMHCLCHVSATLRSSAVDNSDEDSSEEADSEEDDLGVRHDTSVRMTLRNLLNNLVGRLYPHLKVVVNSTEYCFPEPVREATQSPWMEPNQWLVASYGQRATTLRLCLQQNGLPITRKCEGNFLQGAHWQQLTDESAKLLCITEAEQHIITKNLSDLNFRMISRRAPEKAVSDVKNLLEHNIKNLIPADFYYIAKILQNTIKSLLSVSHAVNITQTITSHGSTLSHSPQAALNTEETTSDIVRIYNYLMEVNESIIKPSIVLNSTNMLLDAFENLIDKISLTQIATTRSNITVSATTQMPIKFNANSAFAQMKQSNVIITDSDKLIETVEYDDIGVVVKIASNFLIFAINPNVANVSGIALFRQNSEDEYEQGDSEENIELGSLRGSFKHEFYRFLLANQSIEDLLYEPHLEMATFVPDTLWTRLDEISSSANHTFLHRPDARVVIKVYSNDKLFQEQRESKPHDIGRGKIISISIPGHDKDLPEMLPLFLRIDDEQSHTDNNTENTGCRYWNYKYWANDGLILLAHSAVDENIILCGCTHLTPFAYLIGGSYNLSVNSDSDIIVRVKIHKQALDIITLLGCSLSLFGIVGIFVTAATFQSWRQKASSKVLLQLCTAIALQMILFCFVNTEENSYHFISNEIFSSCIAIGACLHYSVLVQFCWMLIIAYLQFKRYVQVFGNTRPKRFFIKSTVLGWGLPLLPVLIVLFFDRASYIPNTHANSTAICYPTGYSLYLGIVLPITLVILANLTVFIVVIYNILKGVDVSIRHTEKKLAISQIRLSVLLFFLLGFTWIFGLLTAMKAGLIFSYLFSLTATLQGFVLFIYFIILDPMTRRMWGGYFQRILGATTTNMRSYDSSTSMKETTQSL